MGLYDRDYMRRPKGSDDEDLTDEHDHGRIPPKEVVLALVGLLIVGGLAFGSKGLMAWFSKPRILNVNTASVRELDELPSISTSVADGIVAGRPYTNVAELIRVYGIGPKTLERIRPFVKAE